MHPLVPVLVLSFLSTVLLSAAAPVYAQPAEGDVVATGHIAVGTDSFHTFGHTLLSDDIVLPTGDIDSFRFDAAHLVGLWLSVTAPEASPQLHLLKVTFEDSARNPIDTRCVGSRTDHALLQEPLGQVRAEPQCVVPPGTTTARVSAELGLDLDVVVVVAPGPRPPSPDPSVLIKVHYDYGLALFSDAVNALVGANGGSALTRANVTGLDGRTVVTEAIDHGGLGYHLRLSFRDADGVGLDATCQPTSAAPPGPGVPGHADRCLVPDEAATVHLSAYHAKDVDAVVRLEGVP